MHCQNCGQVNTQASNFCRFCGTKFAQLQYSNANNNYVLNGNNYNAGNNLNGRDYELAPPQPYSWKTDEFQLPDNRAPKNKPINRVQPLADFRTQQNIAVQPYQQQQQPAMTNNYHCPRCSSHLFPRSTRQISTAGWIVFSILLVFFFPLFWIGLLIKDDIRVCPVCNLRFN